MVFITTVLAFAMEQQTVRFDDAFEFLICCFPDHTIEGFVQFQVKHIAAGSTYHMIMGIGASVEPVASVGSGDLDNLANVCQKIQIAVHGTKTDIRKFLPHMQVNRICSGMIVPGQQEPFDRFPLPAVF